MLFDWRADSKRTRCACRLHDLVRCRDYYYNVSPEIAKMGDAVSTEAKMMKCSIQGCPGEYEDKLIVHVVQRRGEMFLLEHVPAEVCSICGDTLLTPATVKRIEQMLAESQRPAKFVPMYEFTQYHDDTPVLSVSEPNFA